MKISQLIAERNTPFFSLEFFPPQNMEQLPSFMQTAEELQAFKPLFVSVTYGAGGAKQQNTLAITRELAQKNLTVMPHLTCIGATRDGIKDFLGELSRIGVDNILALRGDAPINGEWRPKDDYFKHAVDLIGFIKETAPAFGIGVAAYPFPHPESPTYESDRIQTALKFACGADFAITQMFFDVREYIELVSRLRQAGYEAPIIPGIMTIQSFDSLKRVMSLCGVQIPAKFYLHLEEAHAKGDKEEVKEAGIKFTVSQIRQLLDSGAPGVHLYTLNKSDLCKRIIAEAGLA